MSSVESSSVESSSVESSSVESSSVEPEAPTPVEDPHRPILDALATELGDALVESHTQRGDLWIRVRADAWKHTGEVLRHQLGFDYFCYLSGIDWMPPTWPNPKVIEAEGVEGEEPEPEPEPAPSGEIRTGYAGGESRFQLLARVYSTVRHTGITLKADLDPDNPAVESWHEVYRGADWHERETWEMYGFDFVGHPNLIHMYLPGGFEGFPLRKDFPLLSREVKPWPGLVDVEQFPASYRGDDAPAEEGEAG